MTDTADTVVVNNNIPTDDVTFEPMGPSEIPSIIADIEEPSPYDEDDPRRPVDDLVKAMAPQRKMLMRILELCRERALVADVKAEVERLQEFMPMVYTAADLCALLVEAGALACVTADGAAYDTDSIEPSIVEENGARYYVANEPDDLYWETTEAGGAWLDDDDPLGRAQKFFDADPDLLPIYKRALLLCDGDGCTIDDLGTAINHDPLVQSPRVYAPFFVDRLERCDAIEWEGQWRLTDVGRDVLALLDDVEDDYDPAAAQGDEADEDDDA